MNITKEMRDDLARKLAASDGLNWDEVCAYEADPDKLEGCDSSTCVAAHYEDHEPDVARANYRKWAEVALGHMEKVPANAAPFQARVQPWMMECFGAEIAADVVERNDRFIEEALELVQANGYHAARAHALVDYVFGRPVGEPTQEVGGVMVTLAALCLAANLDMHSAAEIELARITKPEMVAKIRAKQAAKPTGSALPVPPKQNACRACGGFGTVPTRALYQAEVVQSPCPECQ